jgi:hypothetical protein
MKVPNININGDSSMNTSRVTFRRNGTTYVIKNDGSDEDVADIHNIIDDMHDDVIGLANMADVKASLCKGSHILGTIFVTIAGAVIGALSASTTNMLSYYNGTNIQNNMGILDGIFYVITVLGFCITVIKTLLSIFNIEQKAMILKEIAINLRKIARNIKSLKTLNAPAEEIYLKIDHFHTEVDELNVSLFSSANLPKKKANKIKADPTDINVTI